MPVLLSCDIYCGHIICGGYCVGTLARYNGFLDSQSRKRPQEKVDTISNIGCMIFDHLYTMLSTEVTKPSDTKYQISDA